MPGLENNYVHDLGKLICGESFLGVFPSDIQPQFKDECCKFSLIFNTDNHKKPGSHFVAIYGDKSKLFYFDSFGEKCKYKLIKIFIKKNLKGRKYMYNTKCIQDENSLLCGLFCIAFLNSLNKNISFIKFINTFKTSLKHNDDIVTKMITSEF